MPEIMLPIPDSTFKDDTPLGTVARIKHILNEHHIEVEETWQESGVPYCFSLRIAVIGTTFGVNGKGVTREFALASGYGELMERLQLGYIASEASQKTALSPESANTDRMPVTDLLARNEGWYSLLADKLHAQTGTRLSAQELLAQYADADGSVSVTPYYCVNTRTDEYLPTLLRKRVYSTNGCAAGNTMEEALVQAISEIVERQFKLRVLSEHVPVPDLSEEILKSCKISYDIITFLRENGFRVTVKDCSLGTKFPVVCVCLVDQKTGRYHTHFGAYPKFEIALQRTLTESFQGRTIEKVAKYENFQLKCDDSFALENLMNELVKGTSEKMAGFFVHPDPQICTTVREFSGSTNRELLAECIAFLSEQGHDILVRDCSSLGFPTYQVVIPGCSEVFPHRLAPQHDDLRFSQCTPGVLRNPSAANVKDIMGFMMNLAQSQKKRLGAFSFLSQANLPADLTAAQESFLLSATLAHVHYTLGKYPETVRYIDQMIAAAGPDDTELLVCLKRYLTLSANGCTGEELRSVLDYFHRPETVQTLYTCIAEHQNPLDAFTLHCDLKCAPSCRLYGSCKKQHMDALAQMILDRLEALDPSVLKTQLSEL